MPVDQHAVLRAPRVLGDEVRGPRREAPALREAVVDAARHRHVEDLYSQIRGVALGDPERPVWKSTGELRGQRRVEGVRRPKFDFHTECDGWSTLTFFAYPRS